MKLKVLLALTITLMLPMAVADNSANHTHDTKNTVAASPGWISADSGLYGLEVAWDNTAMNIGLKTAGQVAQERAAEAKSMADKNNTDAMNKALDQFNSVAKKAKATDAEGLEKAATILKEVQARAPEQAQQGLTKALNSVTAAQARNRAGQDKEGSKDPGDHTDKAPETNLSQNRDGDTGTNNQDTAPTGSKDSTTRRTSGSGSFDLMISDRPADISDFDYVDVSFSKARVFPSDTVNETGNSTSNSTEEKGFREISINGSTVDLTTVVGTKAQSIVQTDLEAGSYNKIELYTSNVDASVNGSSVAVKVPPGKLMITKPFTISSNDTTEFVFDIQVVLRGNQQNNQGYILKPVISESGVVGKDVEVDRDGNETSSDSQRPENTGGNTTNQRNSSSNGSNQTG